MHGPGTIHWSMGNLSWVTTMKKFYSPVFGNHQPIAPQAGEEPWKLLCQPCWNFNDSTSQNCFEGAVYKMHLNGSRVQWQSKMWISKSELQHTKSVNKFFFLKYIKWGSRRDGSALLTAFIAFAEDPGLSPGICRVAHIYPSGPRDLMLFFWPLEH